MSPEVAAHLASERLVAERRVVAKYTLKFEQTEAY
jgi:hypothetical protein